LRILASNAPQHFQTVHVGHLDIQRDDVRIKLWDPLQSYRAVRGSPHHLEHGILLERLRDQPTDDH
jgi:hypothetical protein